MDALFEKALIAEPGRSLERLATGLSPRPGERRAACAEERVACFHCGEPCRDATFSRGDRHFCCHGCLTVHDLLKENGLEQFYALSRHPGVRVGSVAPGGRWAYLNEPALQQRLLDFSDGKTNRVTLQVPAIHCVACVWLLENLFRLHPGVGKSQVNFPRREVSVTFSAAEITLGELVALLAAIGYEPRLTLGELEKPRMNPQRQRQWLQIGIAGFAFGNIMLFSIPTYLGLDSLSGPLFRVLFGYLSLGLAAPVLVYCASDYWRSAGLSLRQRTLTLDVPIVLGLVALYLQSVFEIVSGRGEGYLDSLAGLIFFLLCGRAFQQKTFDRIAFDLDYKCFFPLSVLRIVPSGEETVPLSDLRVGDRLRVRHGELIPADARLASGSACIDYSFVTGESEPVVRQSGDYLYAGGQQTGNAIEVEILKAVSQSYLTSLWNHEAFKKDRDDNLNTLTNRYSRRFTRVVIGIAAAAAVFWVISGQPARGLKAFTSVLIVACPCALALAAPFTLGSAQRLLARSKVFLKNTLVLERLAQISAIVFDKTGTLTAAREKAVEFHSSGSSPGFAAAKELGGFERVRVMSLAMNSTHPHSRQIGEKLRAAGACLPVSGFVEKPGHGICGVVDGHRLHLGSRLWLESQGVPTAGLSQPSSSHSCLAIDGVVRGVFVLENVLRPEAAHLLQELGRSHELALLSGDNEAERDRFKHLFGNQARLHFNQSPLEKLTFIRRLQDSRQKVMMVGDGLNDAGALRQSDVGVAVVEQVGAFSPASDVILEADRVPQLVNLLRLARDSARIVRLSFGISAAYNLVGVSIAAAGVLSPLICAILMPISSVSVVLFACGATRWAAGRCGVSP